MCHVSYQVRTVHRPSRAGLPDLPGPVRGRGDGGTGRLTQPKAHLHIVDDDLEEGPYRGPLFRWLAATSEVSCRNAYHAVRNCYLGIV